MRLIQPLVIAQFALDTSTQWLDYIHPARKKRVDSSQKGNEFGMRQVLNLIETLGLEAKLVLNTARSIANQSASLLPKPWEKYLPEYKQERTLGCATPTQVQRNFEDILLSIGSPAINATPRGNPKGRQEGEGLIKRDKQPIHFKGKKRTTVKGKHNKTSAEETAKKSTPLKIEDLLNEVKKRLDTLNISHDEFVNQLLEPI